MSYTGLALATPERHGLVLQKPAYSFSLQLEFPVLVRGRLFRYICGA